jgi:hypothetical protein
VRRVALKKKMKGKRDARLVGKVAWELEIMMVNRGSSHDEYGGRVGSWTI